MTFSLARLKTFLPPLPDAPSTSTWWIALSGGLDSCVLLHSLASLQLPVRLQALHVNHQISSNASSWQQHCLQLCQQLNVPFSAELVTVENSGRGLEDAARAARHEVFERYVKPGDYLFTAHHGDDQAETILLRLLRGSGPCGLAAMAQSRPLACATLHRPLLAVTRLELEAYASAAGLSWVSDESNANDAYDRNYLRNNVMPLLRERWPGFTHKWQQSAELCADSEEVIAQVAAQDLQVADFQPAIIGTSISLTYVESLSRVRRHNLLRSWLAEQGLSLPEQQHLQQIEQQIIGGRGDAETDVSWGDVSLRVYRERLFALPRGHLLCAPTHNPLSVDPSVSPITTLASGWELHFTLMPDADTPLLQTNLPNLNIRLRLGGERCRPAGRAHSQTLKRLLQDYGVEPWLRDCLPLIYSGDNLVAVANLWVCEGYTASGAGYRLKYVRNAN